MKTFKKTFGTDEWYTLIIHYHRLIGLLRAAGRAEETLNDWAIPGENVREVPENLKVITDGINTAVSIADVAKVNIKDKKFSEGIPNRIETALKACGPCLSCADHTAGRIPLGNSNLGLLLVQLMCKAVIVIGP